MTSQRIVLSDARCKVLLQFLERHLSPTVSRIQRGIKIRWYLDDPIYKPVVQFRV